MVSRITIGGGSIQRNNAPIFLLLATLLSANICFSAYVIVEKKHTVLTS